MNPNPCTEPGQLLPSPARHGQTPQPRPRAGGGRPSPGHRQGLCSPSTGRPAPGQGCFFLVPPERPGGGQRGRGSVQRRPCTMPGRFSVLPCRTGRGSVPPRRGRGRGRSGAPPHPHLHATAGGPRPGPGPSPGQEAPPAAAPLRALLLMQLKFQAKPLQNLCGGEEWGLFLILLPTAFPILAYEIEFQSFFSL